jgi:hypothetical protein
MIPYFIENDACIWNWRMRDAAKGNHLNLIEYFIRKGLIVGIWIYEVLLKEDTYIQ